MKPNGWFISNTLIGPHGELMRLHPKEGVEIPSLFFIMHYAHLHL
jgi:hypothetical protein